MEALHARVNEKGMGKKNIQRRLNNAEIRVAVSDLSRDIYYLWCVHSVVCFYLYVCMCATVTAFSRIELFHLELFFNIFHLLFACIRFALLSLAITFYPFAPYFWSKIDHLRNDLKRI